MVNAERIATEAYRLHTERGITPDEVFGDVLRTLGGDRDMTDPAYRRAYRALADAWVEVAWAEMDAAGRLCGHCRQILPEHRTGYCGESCRRRHIEGRTGARVEQRRAA